MKVAYDVACTAAIGLHLEPIVRAFALRHDTPLLHTRPVEGQTVTIIIAWFGIT